METINIESIPRTDNTQIYYIIDAVLKAKTTKKQIKFKYYEYSTANIKALKNGGKKYTVTPYQLVCSNEFYYLIGFSEKHGKTTAFRVDRICGIPELVNKDISDNGKMALRPAEELSYLTHEEQEAVLNQIFICECMPSHAQTIRMRKLSQLGKLDDWTITRIMGEEKPNQADRIRIPYNEIRQYIPRSVSYEKTADYIKAALIFYQQHHSKSSS